MAHNQFGEADRSYYTDYDEYLMQLQLRNLKYPLNRLSCNISLLCIWIELILQNTERHPLSVGYGTPSFTFQLRDHFVFYGTADNLL